MERRVVTRCHGDHGYCHRSLLICTNVADPDSSNVPLRLPSRRFYERELRGSSHRFFLVRLCRLSESLLLRPANRPQRTLLFLSSLESKVKIGSMKFQRDEETRGNAAAAKTTRKLLDVGSSRRYCQPWCEQFGKRLGIDGKTEPGIPRARTEFMPSLLYPLDTARCFFSHRLTPKLGVERFRRQKKPLRPPHTIENRRT